MPIYHIKILLKNLAHAFHIKTMSHGEEYMPKIFQDHGLNSSICLYINQSWNDQVTHLLYFSHHPHPYLSITEPLHILYPKYKKIKSWFNHLHHVNIIFNNYIHTSVS